MLPHRPAPPQTPPRTLGKDLLCVFGVLCAVLLIYARHLDSSPAALHEDETAAVEQARSIAQNGHDLEGRRLPFFFHLRDNVWMPPLPVYWTATLLSVPGGNRASVRLPSVIVAAIDVALMYLLAARLFGRVSLALLASGLLALAPLHLIAGRLALASVYPIAFILVWLLCLTRFIDDRRPALLFASTLSLGIGVYSHPTATLMMPIFFGLTLLTLWSGGRSPGSLAIAAAGFGAPLAVLVPWFYWHYDVFRFTLGDWGLHTLANPRDGLTYSLLNWPALATRSTVYWAYFSPSFLFFTGGAELVTSTQRAGAFLGLTAIPLLVGIYVIVTDRWTDPRWRLILLAFALAPIAASTFKEPKAAGRVLGMLPLGVLVAIAGIDAMIRDRRRLIRWSAIAVVCLLPIQFARFYSDYLTDYPQRSAAAFGQGVGRP